MAAFLIRSKAARAIALSSDSDSARRAADCGHVPSMFSLAECCENGIGGLEKSHYNANWWKTRAHAELGDRNARIWLGSNKLK